MISFKLQLDVTLSNFGGAILAKKSKIEKAKRIEQTIARYADKRAEMIKNHDYVGLSTLPRDASPTRRHNRDELDGRPHAYMRKFQLSRLNFRELAHKGQIPGVRKASW
ncbi:hypothetical protein C5L31_001178 [Secundilactobacillus malefermentans]|uniref:Small ribosomal subunit protein uS14 n=1 Tax=Secundilactobacillus malefermentans TaxID=176292 RepID=A0A4R5NID5_9LACO|nr:hypothetical protein C5L31_001178 [Secundilactobacillus malefermentans]